MSKKVTVTDFIKRARQVHGNTYDYSKAIYNGCDTKLTIICREHGEFLQTPSNHYKGAGCPWCAGNKKMTKDEFIKKARYVHGDEYSYENVVYDGNKAKVKITCRIHGDFEQSPSKHLSGDGCPRCAVNKRQNTMEQRYGAKHALCVDAFKEKAKNTNLCRYGIDNPAKQPSVQMKMKATNLSKYGVEYVLQADCVREKIKMTNLKRYGVEQILSLSSIHDKCIDTLLQHYGVSNPMQSSIIKEKLIETNLERYGCINAAMNKMVIKKVQATKYKNGTFNISHSEDSLYLLLCNIFGTNNVARQYSSDEYPFACDFYIKSRNMYIELNASWTHGGHWFDSNSNEDIKMLELWTSKAVASDYYANAVHVWTERDVRKRNTARNNHLNYVVFWDNNLDDFDLWVSLGCPDGTDYDMMYSWIDNEKKIC